MKLIRLLKKSINTIKNNPKSLFSWNNFKVFIKRLFSKTENENFYNPYKKREYHQWLKLNKEDIVDEFQYRPLISFIIPVYNVKIEYLDKCIQSLLNQKYDNFELCIVDDHSNDEVKKYLSKYNENSKIKICYNESNMNISGSSNRAIDMAKGDFISLVDNDDVLDPYALLYVVKALNENKNLDIIYTDEDKINEHDEQFDPFFKPDWSPDTILSYNYICHFLTIRKELIDKVGGFRSKYDGCQDYDLILRLTEKTNNIYHISKILYHWRSIDTSTAKNINNKNNIVLKTKKMIEETMKRRNKNVNIRVLKNNNFYTEYELKKQYSVSIIIPTKDHVDLLKRCVESIIDNTSYNNYEILIVNNNSILKETFDYFDKCQSNQKIKVIDINTEFNYSYINNRAVEQANGDYIVLLNNDTEVLDKNWLIDMLRFASQKHVGTVGAKLLYADNTVQHGGMIIGFGGVAGHAFIGEKKDYNGPFSVLSIPRNVGGNTAACLMIERKKYLEVGGLDENLKVAFNDVDFNLKIREKGYYNVFLPNVELYHYESKSRGLEDTSEKINRFNSEVTYMKKKWNETLKRDAFYNDNLSYKYNYKLDIK